MSLYLTFPSLLHLGDLALFVLRLVVALVFGASGYYHVRDPVGRWHYDLMLLAINLVIVATAGGRWVVPIG